MHLSMFCLRFACVDYRGDTVQSLYSTGKCCFLDQTLKARAIQNTTPQSPRHQSLKLLDILSKELCRLVIEGVIWIGLVKQIDQSIYNSIDIQDWLPIFSQNIQTYFSIEIDIGMIDFGHAFHFGWRVRVMRWNGELEMIRGPPPVPSVGCDGNFEKGQIVGVGEVHLGDLASVELGNVWSQSRLE